MRISDWSSDVCSSDLTGAGQAVAMPGVVDAIAAMRAAGVTVIVNTNRTAANAKGTEDTLRAAGLGELDRKSVVSGKSVSVRVDLGGRRIIKTKNHKFEHSITKKSHTN